MSAHVKAKLRMIETNACSIFSLTQRSQNIQALQFTIITQKTSDKFKPHYLSISIYPQHASVTPDRKSMNGA